MFFLFNHHPKTGNINPLSRTRCTCDPNVAPAGHGSSEPAWIQRSRAMELASRIESPGPPGREAMHPTWHPTISSTKEDDLTSSLLKTDHDCLPGFHWKKLGRTWVLAAIELRENHFKILIKIYKNQKNQAMSKQCPCPAKRRKANQSISWPVG